MSFSINSRKIGPGEPAYIIAEISANHHQDFDQAVQMIAVAKDVGVDAIKLQTYTPDTMTIPCDNEWFRIGKGTIWEGRVLHDLYADAQTPWEWQPKLKKLADDQGITLFSTPFDRSSVDFLERMDVPAYKIASFEIVDLPLIRKVAETRKPIIMSTGMASLDEIGEALDTARQAGAEDIALLKCTSAYPAPPSEMNLKTIPDLIQRFDVPVGLSDHTLGVTASVAAIPLGACIIEKHFTLSRDIDGPDSAFSLEPDEFRELVQSVRTAEEALGHANYELTENEAASRVFRRSLFAIENIAAGDPFTSSNVRCIRPGHGLAPKHLDTILGKRAGRDIARGTPLSWDVIDEA